MVHPRRFERASAGGNLYPRSVARRRLLGRSPRAQQPDRPRRIGMLIGFDDPDLKAFQQELERFGWSEGRIHIDYRYAPAGTQMQTLAKELVALQPEVPPRCSKRPTQSRSCSPLSPTRSAPG
jgi:hypothetical protein